MKAKRFSFFSFCLTFLLDSLLDSTLFSLLGERAHLVLLQKDVLKRLLV